MKQALCIEFREKDARLVQASRQGAELVVQLDEVVAWPESADRRQRGEQLAAALAKHKLAKVPVVAAVSREQLVWQTVQLPPAPEADLADLVHLQLARDLAADDQTVVDFLPLEGDLQHPYRVLTVVDRRSRVAELRAVCSAAGLQLEAVVPLELGWPHVCPAGSLGDEQAVTFGVAIASGQAVVWVVQGEHLRRIRTCRLPAASVKAAAQVLSGELRRTAMAEKLSREDDCQWLLLVDEATAPVADAIDPSLPGEVDVLRLDALGPADRQTAVLHAENAPLAALAAGLALGNRPRIDLLHPRRRPEPPSRVRTLVLATAAALAIAAAIGWQGHQNLQAPLVEAEAAQREIEQLTPMVEAMAADVERREQVAQWQEAAPNLLDVLADFSQRLRPAPLDSEQFPMQQDAMLTRLSQTKDAYTLTVAIRDAAAAPAVERRLREAQLRVVRQRLEAMEDGPQGYAGQLIVVVRDDAGAATDQEETP